MTNVQVQVLTAAPSLAPLEIERQITFPVEVAMSGLPNIEEIRSVSKFGLSAVTIVFHDSIDTYFARQLVLERLSQAREQIPENIGSPEMGPISTGLGEIYQYEVKAAKGSGYDATALRTIQDWSVRRQLMGVPGVTEVNALAVSRSNTRSDSIRKNCSPTACLCAMWLKPSRGTTPTSVGLHREWRRSNTSCAVSDWSNPPKTSATSSSRPARKEFRFSRSR